MMLCKLSLVLSVVSSVSAFAPQTLQTSTPSKVSLLSAIVEGAEEQFERRSFLAKSVGMTLALSSLIGVPSASLAASADYTAVAADISNLVKASPDIGPTFVRLAWHSSGTYDKMSKDGGSGKGTTRFKEELAHGANAGLAKTVVAMMEPLKEKYGENLSYADLYTLGGVAAIKSMGGPTIPWCSGRVDALDPSAVTPDGRLPNADSGPPGADESDATHLRKVFGRMGFNDQEIVALSGAHALGRCHANASGYDGPWSPTPTTFSNLYYKLLLDAKWTKRDWDGPYQYEDGGKKLMMLPTDYVLIQDAKFLKYVKLYAADEKKFFNDFSVAFHKLEELGTKNLVPAQWA